MREHLGLQEALRLQLDLDDVLEVGHDHRARPEERLQVLGELGAAGVPRVHRDEGADGRDQRNLLLVEREDLLLALDRAEH